MISRCTPRVVIVSTPNVEYNLNMMVRCKSESEGQPHCDTGWATKREREGDEAFLARLKQATKDGRLCKGCATVASNMRPKVEDYPLREKVDHRFEFTQSEFKRWAEGLALEHGYTVSFDGIGGGEFGEAAQATFHGPGPSSQVAVFERKQAVQPIRPSPSPGTLATLVWDSAEDGTARF